MGLDFFRQVVDLQIRFAPPGSVIANALQTNGTLIDGRWAEFLSDFRFLVGLSIDGPARYHDFYRKDAKGRGTHALVMRAAEILRTNGVEFNAVVLVNNVNVWEPDAVYDFLVEGGFTHLQFVPCIEPGSGGSLATFSVTPEAYGRFLVRVFDSWVRDFPRVSVREFDDLLLRTLGRRPASCTTCDRCGDYIVVEHNGDVFACDFFVAPNWRIGSIVRNPLGEIVRSPRLQAFAESKRRLGAVCRECEFLSWCWGGCQKHRVVCGGQLSDPSCLCMAYQMLFTHARPHLGRLAGMIRQAGLANDVLSCFP